MISRLGRFEIQAEIGRGGFGQVFRAFDPIMNRIVAVKVLTATDDAGSFNRFKNEATAAGNLHHENIVTVYEFGQESQTPFLVMEYLNGEDLAHFIKNQTPLSLYQKVRIMDQVADGLHCAHLNGVLHRDVKPANVMVLKDGAVKIMDFGIARLMRDTATRLTMQGYLIGTVVYMAPELFSGEMEVDSLCDIWSYGVIMYELLHGKNPFQTGSMQSEMYRIVNLDPPALPPEECPPDLQAVLSRLLSRQREHRYQTLEETRFDLQPILKNLEKSEADRLVSIAQQLMFEERFDEAQDIAGKARKLDPNNGTARIIFKQIQDRKKGLALRPRVDALLQRANEAEEQGKLQEAIEALKAALEIDSSNDRVSVRLQELRKLKARREEAARLVVEAADNFRDGHLADALEHASEAVHLDPDNQEASRLLESIQGQLQAQEADRALETEILRARGLIAIDELDGAMATLKAAESKFPGRPNAGELVARVAQLITERDQRREFSRRKEHAKDLVRNSRFEEAVDELERLLQSFPNDTEVNDLLPYARQEFKSRQRSEEVKRITEAATELSQSQRFDEAILMLEEGLKKCPDDPLLTRMIRTAHFDLQQQEREKAFRSGFQNCEALRRGGQFQEALDLIARLISDNPTNQELPGLAFEIRQEKSRAERETTVRSAIDEAEKLLREHRPEPAVSVLEAAMLAVGGDPKLAALLEKAKAERQAERDRQYIDSELKHARVFEDRGDAATSLRIIEDALVRSPKSRELIAARDRLRTLGKRAQEVSDLVAAIEGLSLRKEWALALEKLDRARKAYPSENVFVNLELDLRRRKSDQVNQLVRECRRLLDSGTAAEAEQFLSANLLDFRDDPEVIRLGNDILNGKSRRENQEQVSEATRAVQDRERNNDLPGALDILQKALQRFPQDPDLLSTQRRVKQAQVLALIRQALQRSDWVQALQFLEQARQEFPTDPALIPLQAEALDQRRSYLENAVAAIRGNLRDDRIEDAMALYQHRLAAHHDQSIVRTVLQEIEAAKSASKTLDEKRATLQPASVCEDKQDFAGALAILKKAQIKYPGDAEVQSAITRVERKRAVAEKIAAVRKDVDRGALQEALKKLAEVRTEFPDSAAQLDPLEQQARKLRDREIQKLVDKGNELLRAGKVADAEKFLNKQLAPFASEPAVAALAKAIREEKAPRVAVPDVNRAKTTTAELTHQEAAAKPQWKVYAIAAVAVAAVAGVAVMFWPTAVTVDPLKLHFEYPAGSTPEAQTITVTGVAEVTAPHPPEDWLLVTRSTAAANKAEFKVRVLPDKLAPGSYSAVLVFPHDKKVPVDLVVPKPADTNPVGGTGTTLPPPGPDIQPPAITFPYSAEAIPGQKILVTSSSDIPEPKASERWITFTRRNLGPGKAEFIVQASSNGLPPGRNTAYLVFTPTKRLHVELTVPGQVQLDVQPDSLAFPSGGAQQTVTATGTVIPDPVSTDPWLTFTRHNIAPGNVQFTVQTSSTGLAPATHIAYLNFSAMKKVRVELTIAAPPPPPPPPPVVTFDVLPKELHFTWKRTSPVAPLTVTVTGPPDIGEPRKTAAWLSVTKRGTTGNKTEFSVQVTPDKLAGGSYPDDLVFTGPNSQQKAAHVDLTVFDAPDGVHSPFGTVIWSGASLNPGDELWIKERRVLKGPGTVNSRLPRADVVVDKSKLPPSIHIVEEPSQENNFILRLSIVSGAPVSDLTISWSSKK